MAAHIVRTLQLTTIRAFVESFHAKRIMSAAIAATMRGYFSLGDSHGGTIPRIKSFIASNNWASYNAFVSVAAHTDLISVAQG